MRHPSHALAVVVVLSAACLIGTACAQEEPTIVVQWNSATLQGVRDSKIGPPMVARALAIVHTCMYNAWSAYDENAKSTVEISGIKKPLRDHSRTNIEQAVSIAAYRCASDLFPGDKDVVFVPLLRHLGYNPNDTNLDASTPAGVGNLAADAVLAARHHDGANQLGDMTPSGVPYADWTGYHPVNPPSTLPVNVAAIVDPNRWQPYQYTDGTGSFVTQPFLGAQWYRVTPFAMASGDQFRSLIAQSGPAEFGTGEYVAQAEELIAFSANLTDEQKMIAEYWKDGPHSETPPGHWCLFAQFVSARDHHTLDDDVKMFFALTNAVFDASIACWDAKRAFDSVRPATAIPFLFQGQQIRSWGGPNQGTITMDGSQWIPYQPGTFPTPPFPEYISGHSTFSAAGAEILRLWTGSDDFGDSVTFAPGSSLIEPGTTPAAAITLAWPTFTAAANQAGISRRYGGIHFRSADLVGRATGRLAAQQVWQRAMALWQPPSDPGPRPLETVR
jgi:hypothetical protein